MLLFQHSLQLYALWSPFGLDGINFLFHHLDPTQNTLNESFETFWEDFVWNLELVEPLFSALQLMRNQYSDDQLVDSVQAEIPLNYQDRIDMHQFRFGMLPVRVAERIHYLIEQIVLLYRVGDNPASKVYFADIV
jgi:hypothetical protein